MDAGSANAAARAYYAQGGLVVDFNSDDNIFEVSILSDLSALCFGLCLLAHSKDVPLIEC